jgi:DNA adenine methylase
MFPYPGGKSKISKWTTQFFPTDSSLYGELFGGAFWTYFKWDKTPAAVVYNDLNAQLVNLFRCASSDATKLATMLSTYPGEDVQVFEAMRTLVFTKYGGLSPTFVTPDFEAAVAYAYLQLHHFIGHQITPTLRYQHIDTVKWSSRYQAFIRKLNNIKYRTKLAGITDVENADFEEVLIKHDSASAFFYVDPPYWNTEHYYTEGSFNQADHLRLAACLSNMSGKFALSYYDFPELQDMYPKDQFRWIQKEFLAPMSAGAVLARTPGNKKTKVDTAKHQAMEILILNY